MKDYDEDFADQLGRFLTRAGLTQQELADKMGGRHRNTISSWLNRARRPQSRGQVLWLADELFLTKEERKAFIQAAGFSVEQWPTEVWIVPQQRDRFFTGRDEVFQYLRQLLVPGSAAALTQAISGLGGIGKTHTAVEYAYRYHQYYEAVLWLQADSWEVLVLACMKLADELGLPKQKETDQVIVEVQHWLRKHRHWLLILDNVENPQEILTKFVPTRHQGCVLVTTRVHDVEPLARTRVLSTMVEQEGVLFLLRRTNKIAPKAGLEKASPEQYMEVQQIWHLLDGLPLALDQAGAYIRETQCSFSAYKEQYDHRRNELLDRRGKRFIGHEESVATTFFLAFERVEAVSPAAADILRVCSWLHSEAIPEEIFLEGAKLLGPYLSTGREGLDLAVGLLQDYSLVLRNSNAKTLTVHRLVQAVLQDAMPAAEQEVWIDRIIAAINTIFPNVKYTNWNYCERLVPHVLACTTHPQSWKNMSIRLASLLFKTAKYLGDRAQYVEAEPLYQRALYLGENIWGPDHHYVCDPLNNLGTLYRKQGKYAEAEPLYRRALHIREHALGPDHPDMAYPLDNLADLYIKQGKYAEAEPLYQRALHIRERTLGPDHPDVAYPINGLADVYYVQDKFDEAELLYQRALHILEKALGLDPPDVTYPLNGLADVYRKQGKYAEAEPLYRQALHIRERALGPDHPDIAAVLNDLGNLYYDQSKYIEAEPLYQRALHILEKALGLTHPDIAAVLSNLGALYYEQSKYAEAKLLYQRALHIEESYLGPEHPKTIETSKYYDSLFRETDLQGEPATLEISQPLPAQTEETREE